MDLTRKPVIIGDACFDITTDHDYGKHLGDRFEPATASLLAALCDPGARVLDVGANIGITGLLFAARASKVAAVEPVPAAFDLLRRNLTAAGVLNVSTHNFALGAAEGAVTMQGNPDNLSGSFIADRHSIRDNFHFSQQVPLHRLDDVFGRLDLDGVDLIKIDVEGYELDVLEGARQVLQQHRPMVLLEMNYVALNLWRRLSVPEFIDRLLAIFPHVYAVDGAQWLDLRDEGNAHVVQFSHLTKFAYMDVVAGFDQEGLVRRLERVATIRAQQDQAASRLVLGEQLVASQARADALAAELEQARRRVTELERSTSWRITAPLRSVSRVLKGS